MNSEPVSKQPTTHSPPLDSQMFLRLRDSALLRLRAAKGVITLYVAFSTLTGYVVHMRGIDLTALIVSAGVMFLAAGSATLNNVQDRVLDRRFSRTSHRPLARGDLSAGQGIRQAAALLSAGCLLLYLSPQGPLLVLLGLAAVVCYNGLYTPFKIRTLWSVVPGVACGMIPPLSGWVAAGGDFWSPRIWLIMVLLGIWQPPHSWLILLAHADELRASKVRNIFSFFSTFQIQRILFVWVCSFIAMIVLLPLFGLLHHSFFFITLVFACGLVTVCYAWGLFTVQTVKTYQRLFTLLNSLLALTMLCCILDNLLVTTFS